MFLIKIVQRKLFHLFLAAFFLSGIYALNINELIHQKKYPAEKLILKLVTGDASYTL